MPKDFIDVIDTAVKIGLGALISGVTTYFVANKNHSNEKGKVLIEKKIGIIEHSIENIESYFYALNQYLSRIDGVLKGGQIQGGNNIDMPLFKSIKEVDDNLTSKRKERSVAISRLKLIGARDLTKHIGTIGIIENEIRALMIFEKTFPTTEQYQSFKVRFENAKGDFYESLESEFVSIHS